MDSHTPELPRFQRASRRAFLARLAGAGALVASGGLVAACSGSDASVLSGSSASGASPAPTVASTATTAASGSNTGSAGDSTGTPAATAPKGTIKFGYSGSGKNPYLAVFIEDAKGALVKTVALWYLQGKGDRWLPELSTWYALGGQKAASLSAVTGSTRRAGSYTLAWDGTDDSGKALATGSYTLFIEGSREHGPHSLTSVRFNLGPAATVNIPASGEIAAGTFSIV